jgi:hypothetical protein
MTQQQQRQSCPLEAERVDRAKTCRQSPLAHAQLGIPRKDYQMALRHHAP